VAVDAVAVSQGQGPAAGPADPGPQRGHQPGGTAGEFKVRGTARAEEDPAPQRRYADAVTASLDWSPVPGEFHLFAIDIAQVTFMRYDPATGDQFTAMWPPGREFVRRGTSATVVGAPEPFSDLISPG
jgi:hypothetical protein